MKNHLFFLMFDGFVDGFQQMEWGLKQLEPANSAESERQFQEDRSALISEEVFVAQVPQHQYFINEHQP